MEMCFQLYGLWNYATDVGMTLIFYLWHELVDYSICFENLAQFLFNTHTCISSVKFTVVHLRISVHTKLVLMIL